MRDRYDELFASGAAAVLGRQHECDSEPDEGGRWPVTILSRFSANVAELLHGLTLEAAALAGPDHFVTGVTDSSHLTWRALDGYRSAARADEPVSLRWAQAMSRTAMATPAFRLRFTGLTLTPSSVMAQVEAAPGDPSVHRLMRRLDDELGADGWYEDGYIRTLTYANLLHFTGPVAHPRGLVDFVRQRRELPAVDVDVEHLELIRSEPVRDGVGRRMRPTTWLREGLQQAGQAK